MQVRAGCELSVEADAPSAIVCMLEPRGGRSRWRINDASVSTRAHAAGAFDDAFGNRCHRLVLPEGPTTIRIDARVQSRAEPEPEPGARWVPPDALPAETLQFLLPSRYCPSDRPELYDQARAIVGDAPPGFAQAQAIRDWIATHVAYRPGSSDAHTDARDTLATGAGVCRDFAHVGATLCRTLDIPARVAVGWLHDLKPMDMHAWCEAYVGDRWHAFDAVPEAPRSGRVVIGHGRDAADVAFLTSFRPLRSVSIRVWTELDAAA